MNDNQLNQHIQNLKVFQAASGNKYPDGSTLRRFQENWKAELLQLIKQDRELNPLQDKFKKVMWLLAAGRSSANVKITISNTYGGLSSSHIDQEIVHQGRTLEKHLDKLIEQLTTNSEVMSMEKYVVSHELAKRLKEAGYPQDAIWFSHTANDTLCEKTFVDNAKDLDRNDMIARPLTDELLEQLPKTISVKGDYSLLHLIKTNGYNISEDTFMAQYDSNIIGKGPHGRLFENKPADSLAQLWLWCKDHGYIKTNEEE